MLREYIGDKYKDEIKKTATPARAIDETLKEALKNFKQAQRKKGECGARNIKDMDKVIITIDAIAFKENEIIYVNNVTKILKENSQTNETIAKIKKKSSIIGTIPQCKKPNMTETPECAHLWKLEWNRRNGNFYLIVPINIHIKNPHKKFFKRPPHKDTETNNNEENKDYNHVKVIRETKEKKEDLVSVDPGVTPFLNLYSVKNYGHLYTNWYDNYNNHIKTAESLARKADKLRKTLKPPELTKLPTAVISNNDNVLKTIRMKKQETQTKRNAKKKKKKLIKNTTTTKKKGKNNDNKIELIKAPSSPKEECITNAIKIDENATIKKLKEFTKKKKRKNKGRKSNRKPDRKKLKYTIYDLRKSSLKYFTKATNIVKDMQHKSATYLCSHFDHILMAEMKTSEMLTSDNIHGNVKKGLQGSSAFAFRQKLIGRAKQHSTTIIFCREHYTSKTCTNCGNIKEDLGGNKVYKCIFCNTVLHRDYNAARNILIKGLSSHTPPDLMLSSGTKPKIKPP